MLKKIEVKQNDEMKAISFFLSSHFYFFIYYLLSSFHPSFLPFFIASSYKIEDGNKDFPPEDNIVIRTVG